MKGKGRRLPGLIFAAAVLLAAGCGREELPELPDVEEEQNAGEQDAGEQNGEEQTAGEQTAGEQNAVYPRELQRGELKAFTNWIDTADDRANYGFLLSEYEDPRELDLNQLLYTGAGMETPSLTEDERQAYLEITGQPEIYTDVVRLTTEQIDGFLEQKTGYTLDEMTGPFDWTYLEETDAWVHQHGDTNYMPFTCVRGWETEKGSFELECVPGDGQLTPDLYPSCRLRLARHGDDYRVLSNAFDRSIVYSKDIWKIEDQSFEVDLGGSWGQAAYIFIGAAGIAVRYIAPWVKDKYKKSILYLKGGDIAVEVELAAHKCKIRRELIEVTDISRFFKDEYFTGKRIVEIKR